MHDEGHSAARARLPLLKTERRILDTLTPPQIRQLVEWRPRTFAQHRLHALLLTVLDTGIRIDEALKLEWADVDFETSW